MPDLHPPSQSTMQRLPLWAQVLAATRTVMRAQMAIPADDAALGALGATGLAALGEALRAAERCSFRFDFDAADERALLEGASWRGQGGARHEAFCEAVYFVVDACRAASAAYDFPVDATVTRSALRAIEALAAGDAATRLRVWSVAAAEIDLLEFASSEARQGTYDPVPRGVRGRLLPLQPLA